MIKRILFVMLVAGAACSWAAAAEDGWIELFDGTLKGWQRTENMGTWSVKDGLLVTDGPRSHLFYVGPVENTNFRNFEFKAEIKTTKGSNSGIYFHTSVQKSGWPDKGYEVQVNNTHSDRKKTGGLYAVRDVLDKSPADDGEWFTEHIIVQGSDITIKVNGKTTAEWTEPPNYTHPRFPGRKLSSGTFALQGHDPKSVVYYRSIKVKPLPPRLTGTLKVAVLTGGHAFERKPFTEMLNSFKGMKCTEIDLKDHSEIFEDISNWDYDVIVMYNMTQNISKKRQENFKKLLDRGIGYVCLHHNMGAFQSWPEFKKISGGKYYVKPTKEGDKEIRGSTYKHDLDMNIKVADKSHPITRGLKDFKIHDEGYKYCGFEKDNRVLLTTNHENCDRTVAWVSKYRKAKVCGIMLGHDGKAYANPSFKKLLSQAINWTAGRLK
ncbi:MAG: DUF1080 domain-containing protein [Phycisphaerae bacterium]|nr:DUF1080 domain-containing protein [Phycisphaerae bacterium]